LAQGHKSDEKIVFVGDSRVRHKSSRLIAQDYSAYPGKSEVFIPNFLLKEWMVATVFMVGLLVLVVSKPAPLGYPADPTNSQFLPIPDWYFLFLYQLLKYPYTAGDFKILGTVVVPGIMFGALTLVPFLDTGKERRFTLRPITTILMSLSLVATIYLTAVSWHHYQVELEAKGITPEHIEREEELKAARSAGKPAPKPADKNAALPAIVAADDPGAKLYAKSTCITCHQADLKGMKGAIPALLGTGDKYDKTAILNIIKNGQGSMTAQYQPNKDKGLSDADIDSIATWLSKQKKTQ
jgi:menaquinol-cytochrome c reductase cytochrome b/c subunit